ncbi:MAG: tetratricopeptide repeat protein [Methylovulum sp.]|nr:tetratricopeptide repeat protein [Methylovulum sp.]
MDAFPEAIEDEFKEMAFVLENAGRGCWIIAVCNQASARAQIIQRLQTESALPLLTWEYQPDQPYPIGYLNALSLEQQRQQAIVCFINTVQGGDKTLKSLDFNREKFAQYPHSLIFWVTEHERGELARKAGHFWAQRRGSFDFSAWVLPTEQQNTAYGIGDWLNNLVNIDGYQEALRQLAFYQQLLAKYSQTELPTANTSLLIAETADKIAYLLYYLGRYSEAVAFCQQALAIYQSLSREKAYYPVIATANNLALLYLRSGSYSEVEPLLQKALADLESFDDLPLAKATVLNNMGWLYYIQGRYAEAEPLFQRSLVIREKALGDGHPNIATSLNNLAVLFHAQGRYAEAEPLYQRSLAIRENILGSNHPNIATSLLNNLAELFRVQGRYAEAEPLYQRSLAIREKALGSGHPDVATSLNNLAELFRAQGRYAEAEPLYHRSLAILEKALGKNHPEVAASLNNLALLYESQSKYAKAEPLYKRSLAILKTALGEKHPNTKICKANYQRFLAEKGQKRGFIFRRKKG